MIQFGYRSSILLAISADKALNASINEIFHCINHIVHTRNAVFLLQVPSGKEYLRFTPQPQK